MALVSPGVQLSITDEAPYLPTSVGSVPFIVIATAQNKTINGVTAPATTKTNAGKIYGVTSQRELTSLFGAPIFRRSSADTPLHGDELNEYGLMAAYSALGLGNRAWVVRADIDLSELVGTSNRPRGYVANGTSWLDTANTSWGIYEFASGVPSSTSPFTNKLPHVITSSDQVDTSFVPLASIGDVGDYAVVVMSDQQNFVYNKVLQPNTSTTQWVPLGSNEWKNSIAIASSSRTTQSAQLATIGNIAVGSSFMINGNTITINSVVNSLTQLKSEIDNDITGVTSPNGTIASITMATPGSGYVTAPVVTITGAGGSNATATAVLGTGADADKVVSYIITNPGSSYTSVSISVAAPTKTTATATATLGTDDVASITVGVQGAGYLTAPTVTIDPPPVTAGNVTATATAVLGTGVDAGKVVSITITNAGTGYTGAPAVTIAAPTAGSAATATGAIGTSTVGAIPGVKVAVSSLDRLQFFANALSASTGIVASPDGKLSLRDGTNSPLTKIGMFGEPPPLPANLLIANTGTLNSIGVAWDWDIGNQRWHQARYTFDSAAVVHAPYTQAPSWRREQSNPRPTGSVWMKTSAEGFGTNIVFKNYNSSSNTWVQQVGQIFADAYEANKILDRSGGGLNIATGSIFVLRAAPTSLGDPRVGFKLYKQRTKGQTRVTGGQTAVTLVQNWQFEIKASQPDGTKTVHTCTIPAIQGGVTNPHQKAFVQAILNQNIPNVSAVVESSGAVTIIHRSGGIITISNSNPSNDVLGAVGFTVGVTGVEIGIGGSSTDTNLTNWSRISSYTISQTIPATDPADGKLWYYNDAAVVDIMISDDTGWKGYRTVASDSRGYDLRLTDSSGVIVSATQPVTQQNGNLLQSGDLWLDSGDLENYPRLYRYDRISQVWNLINNGDTVTQNGIIFADARWDSTGTTDPVTGTLPTIASLLSSNYVDQDAPDYRLFPRGALLFNTRRSGYTVKKFVSNYFNNVSFPDLPATPGAGSTLPSVRSTWVTEIGYRSNGHPKMGHYAQRNEVVAALKSAIDANTDLREEGYTFNLLTAPGYPELISNLVALNTDRGETGFVIGDTPLTLPSSSAEIVSYENTEATTGNPYLAIYYPGGLTNDLGGNEIAVPASHMMLRTFLYNDQVAYPWFAPAGTRRGLVDNALAIGYVDSDTGTFMRTGINNGLRDTLYDRRMNPITLLNGVGLVAYGQKTRSASGASMDRINVSRLVNYLRTVLSGVANQFIFEPNDKITRDQIKSVIEGLMNDLIAKRGLYDYLVVCDETNNTSDRIARNELYVDIAIEPMKSVEFIYIPLRLRNPGTISGSSITTETNQ